MPLQRTLSDFGFEHSFASGVDRLREHYGFEISKTTLARITLKHAHQITKQQGQRPNVGALPKEGRPVLIAEADGTYLRIVETTAAKDRRRTRKVDYQEARLCAAVAQGSRDTFYEATFKDVDEVGLLWAHAAKNAGWALNSKLHIVSDGAPWIHSQAQCIFAEQGTFLVDFYHLCQYLCEAAESCADKPSRWLKTQKKRLKTGHFQKVIDALEEHLEADNLADEQAPVRRAWRYMKNRSESLNYHQAMAQHLPIGSGLIESGHKHVLQARLKIPGAAWTLNNAEAFVQTRAIRANRQWQSYWDKIAA